MAPAMLKNLMSILLVSTGVLHLVVAAVGAPPELQLPLGVFGALFAALGVWIRRSGKPAVLTAIAAATAGVVLGGGNYIQNGGPITLPVMFLIDVVIIGAGALWLMRSGKSA